MGEALNADIMMIPAPGAALLMQAARNLRACALLVPTNPSKPESGGLELDTGTS